MTKKTNTDQLIGGKTLDEWDLEWKKHPGGFAAYRDLRQSAGLYRVLENGKIIAIGKGSGQGGSRLAKRMYDYIRPGDSGRDHHIGRYIHMHQDRLELQVLIVGKSLTDCKIADELRKPMIDRHNPRENVDAKIVRQKAFGSPPHDE